MNFKADLDAFVGQLRSVRPLVRTEEATKTSMIMPLFGLLGWNVFDPGEFMPEFTADVGIKKGEKVDYAILRDGEPVIIIEAKAAGSDLNLHKSQLFRYFATVSAKIAVLTDGIRYRFYTDMEDRNRMDETPFAEIDLFGLKPSDADVLGLFRKDSFDVGAVLDWAFRLKYRDVFARMLEEQFAEPTDDFVSFFVGAVHDGRRTSSVIGRFRPILKEAMAGFLSGHAADRGDQGGAVDTSGTDAVPKARNRTEKPAGFVVTDVNGRHEYGFRTFVDMTVKLCEHCIVAYGFDNFSAMVCDEAFFEKSRKRKVFSMDEADMRGFPYWKFDGGLYMLTNYSADALGRIREKLLDLFGGVQLEVL